MPAMLSKAQSRPGGTPVGAGDARGRLAEGVPVPEPGCVSGGESGRRLSAAERRGPSLSSQAGQERTSPLEQRGWGGAPGRVTWVEGPQRESGDPVTGSGDSMGQR